MNKITVSFNHRNSLRLETEDGYYTFIALPPTLNGCDIITMGDKIESGYKYKFDGLVVMTKPNERQVWHRGDILAIHKR